MNSQVRVFCLISLLGFCIGCETKGQFNQEPAGTVAQTLDSTNASPGPSHVQASRNAILPQPKITDFATANFRILFIGNSHTSNYNVPELVKQFLESTADKPKVKTQTIGCEFLEGLASDEQVQSTIESGDWDVVVLQAQKISSSGKYLYSTDDAKQLSKLAHDADAQVVLFSEWGRLNVAGETERTQKIYEEIQQANNDTLAPIGQAWEAAMKKRPGLVLHAGDGNHANATGAWLTALTIFAVISAEDCRNLPTLNSTSVDEDVQEFFKDVVAGVHDSITKASLPPGQ